MTYLSMQDLAENLRFENRYAALEREYYLAGLGQARPQNAPQKPGVVTITDLKLVPWIANPTLAAAKEAQDLLDALTLLRDTAGSANADLKKANSDLAARKARLDRIRAQHAALSHRGMGELMELESNGVLMDPNSISGLFDGIRKSISNVGRAIDKNVTQRVTHPVRDFTMKQAPWLKNIDKGAIRPAVKAAKRGMAVLDKYVPGWMTVLDFVVPLPGIGTILGAAAGTAGTGLLSVGGTTFGVASQAGNLAATLGLPTSGILGFAGNTVTLAAQTFQPIIKAAVDLSSPVTSIVTTPGGPVGEFVQHFPLTISKGTHTYISTKGSFLQKLERVGLEAMSGFATAVSLAASVVTLGGSTVALTGAIQALNLSLTALKTGISLVKVHEAARIMKRSADKVRAHAQAEAARIAAEEAAYLAEIQKIKDSIEAVRRERERLATAKRTTDAVSPQPDNPVAKLAEKTGLSEETLILGGLGSLVGLIGVVYVVKRMKDGD